ncbi:MAG TPA: sulfurtransferase [Candidatus Latescibacteria bacterium]|nr:sulfurtransferase [Candidatus Latescibacterota bacterium]
MDHTVRFEKICDEARSRIRETTIDEIKERIASGEELHLVDVREESEWEEGHLPGAVHLSKGIIERDIEEHFPDYSTEIVLYCGGGYRSALATDNVQKMGYANVISMDGGYRGWTDAGYPVDE